LGERGRGGTWLVTAHSPLPVLRERVRVRGFLCRRQRADEDPHPRPLPEYDSTELVEVRERE
jgi:hypothetical protein